MPYRMLVIYPFNIIKGSCSRNFSRSVNAQNTSFSMLFYTQLDANHPQSPPITPQSPRKWRTNHLPITSQNVFANMECGGSFVLHLVFSPWHFPSCVRHWSHRSCACFFHLANVGFVAFARVSVFITISLRVVSFFRGSCAWLSVSCMCALCLFALSCVC